MRAIISIVYLAVGLFQFFATIDGIKYWLDIGTFFAVVISFFVAWIPLAGTIAGVLGAHYAWDWSWLSAIALFFGPHVVILALLIVATIIDRARTRT